MQMIAVRHAATVYNKEELINGAIDEPLSDLGLGQIPGIIDSLSAFEFDMVYASPLQRSQQTARPIAEHFGLPVITDERLTEVDLGSFNGKPWSATIPAFGLNSSGVLSGCEYDFRPYGGESADETRARVVAFIEDLRTRGQEKPLIVGHGGILRWFHYICTGKKAGRIPNATVFVFDI